jgi:hypothetical protein
MCSGLLSARSLPISRTQVARQSFLEFRIVFEPAPVQFLVRRPEDVPIRAVDICPHDFGHSADMFGELLERLACAFTVAHEHALAVTLRRHDALQELLRHRDFTV